MKIYPEPHKSNTQITVGLAGISIRGFPEEAKPELALVDKNKLNSSSPPKQDFMKCYKILFKKKKMKEKKI